MMRAVWGVCLALGATVAGVGLELYSSGAGLLLSYTVVVAGILFVPVASAAIDRLAPQPASPRD
jgi:hypothetical protein